MNPLRSILTGVVSLIKGLGVTLSYLPRKKVTLQYPEQRPELSERFRGIPALPIDLATGRDRCIACSACQRVCPVQVITVTAEVGEDKKRKLGDFTLDSSRCIFCGLCTEVCPVGAIRMSDEYELANSTRENMVLGLEKLHQIGGHFPVETEPEADETGSEASAPSVKPVQDAQEAQS